MTYQTYKILFSAALFAGLLLPISARAAASSGNSPITSLQSGLLGHWTFDGRHTNWTKGLTYDQSGNGRNGTLTGMSANTSPRAGKLGQAFKFSGSGSRIATASEFIGTTAASACFWLYPAAVGAEVYISNGNFHIASASANRFSFQSDGVTSVNSATNAITPNAWNFLCATRNASGTANLYKNGVLTGAANQSSGTPEAGLGNVIIAANYNAGSPTNDIMDDVRIYNRVLSAVEIKQLYQLGQAKFANSPITSLQNGLVGYWTFDGQHTNWRNGLTYDQSGNGNKGTLTSMSTSTAPTAGKLGQALNFDGVNDYVTAGDINAMDSQSAFTVSAWVKLDSLADDQTTAGKYVGGIGLFFQTFSTSDIAFGFNSSNYVFTTGNILSISGWQHWVGTFDSALSAGKHKVYLNGVSQTLTNTGSPDTATSTGAGANFEIGRNNGLGRYSGGSIDDVRVYNRALSAGEIGQLYNLGAAKFANSPVTQLQNGLVGYWTFDGQVTNWTNGLTYDQSGNGNKGTLTSMSTSTAPTAGKLGQALNFDGTNDNVTASSDFIGTTAGTYSAWIRPKVSTSGIVISNNRTRIQLASSNRVQFTSDGGTNNVNSANNAIAIDSWFHVTVTRDASGAANIYVNGVLSGSANQDSGAPVAGTANVQAGSVGGAASFSGKIDEVRIYNRVLSPAEIQKLYQLGR